MIVIHPVHTDFACAIKHASDCGTAGAHYVVPDPRDPTYIAAGFKRLRILNLMDECLPAVHVPPGRWRGRCWIDDCAIRVLVLSSPPHEECKANRPFAPVQFDAVAWLLSNLLTRHPHIAPQDIVADSDVAPTTVTDSPLLPWKALHDAGVGAWFDEDVKQQYLTRFASAMPVEGHVVRRLHAYGYDVGLAHTEAGHRALIRAFQMHFRPTLCDGELDADTVATLYALG